MSLIKALVALTMLQPLIARNYRLRKAGKTADQWYWADKLALKWGMWKLKVYAQ